jgi:hypothetical protein
MTTQCQMIFNSIKDKISGSKNPGFGEKIQYAFGKRRIEKQQEDLRRVQHMFMFMTTTLSYMPPSQSVSSTGQAPTGCLRGTLEHVPIKINMGTNADGPILYEATIKLRPAKPAGSKEKITSKIADKRRQIEQLENMRRSPYFASDMLRPVDKYRPHGEEDLHRMKMSSPVLVSKLPSKELAAEEVKSLLSQVRL